MKYLGNIYHPILHRIRNSNIFNHKKIKLMIKNSFSEDTNQKRRILVDISKIYRKNGGTGMPRVTKEVSDYLAKINSESHDIIFVYEDSYNGFFNASNKEKIIFNKNDIFFGLEFSSSYIYKYKKFFSFLRKKGVKISFFIHDLIPIRNPSLVLKKVERQFKRYIYQVIKYDQIICNSKATADDLKDWLKLLPQYKYNPSLNIEYSLLGCNFNHSKEVKIKNYDSKIISFLMVSTVEIRKKYDQAVKAFNILWKKGFNIELRIVGRKGWKADNTFRLIENNPEFNKKLFWYNTGISDEELAKLYKQSDCVIMTSLTEGFGLAITEAALFGKPLIIRNIPVFKEIAGNNAFYFEGLEPENLATKIEEWISLYKENKEPDSSQIKFRTWENCSNDIFSYLTEL